MTAKAVTFSDGRFVIKTDFGDMQTEMSHISAVYLNRRTGPAMSETPPRPATPPATPPAPPLSVNLGPATPAPRPAGTAEAPAASNTPDPGDIQVLTADGQFTFRSCALSDAVLTGRSAILGTVTLKRDSLRLIRFFHALQ